jgi:hypothetical protein
MGTISGGVKGCEALVGFSVAIHIVKPHIVSVSVNFFSNLSHFLPVGLIHKAPLDSTPPCKILPVICHIGFHNSPSILHFHSP